MLIKVAMSKNTLDCGNAIKITNLKEFAKLASIELTTAAGKRKTNRVLCEEVNQLPSLPFEFLQNNAPFYDETKKKSLVTAKISFIDAPQLIPTIDTIPLEYISSEPFDYNGTQVVNVHWSGFENIPSIESWEQIQKYETVNGKIERKLQATVAKETPVEKEQREKPIEEPKKLLLKEEESNLEKPVEQFVAQTLSTPIQKIEEQIEEKPQVEKPLPSEKEPILQDESKTTQKVEPIASMIQQIPKIPKKTGLELEEEGQQRKRPRIDQRYVSNQSFGFQPPPPPPSMLTTIVTTRPPQLQQPPRPSIQFSSIRKPAATLSSTSTAATTASSAFIGVTASTSQRQMPQVAAAGDALRNELNAAIEPCTFGNVDRCCLLRDSNCGRYTVDLLDTTIYGTIITTKALGEGTYGKVYKTDTGYAVKIFVPRDKTEEIFMTDLREIVILRNLIHPNVIFAKQVAIRKASISLPQIGMVMSYYPQTLYQFDLRQNRPLRATILYQLMRAVAFIHSRGVWHRDIKPGNILYNPQKNHEIVLADFGLAQGLAISHNRYSTNILTLYYRAPEILLNEERYSSSIDIWSVGATWLDLLHSLFFRPKNRDDDEFHILQLIFATVGLPNQSNFPKALQLPDWQQFREFNSKSPLSQQFSIYKQLVEWNIIDGNEYDLLSKTLQLDPEKRITAQTALSHRYFDRVRDNVERLMPARPLSYEKLTNCGSVFLAMELPAVGDYLEKNLQGKQQITAVLNWLYYSISKSLENHRISIWFFAVSIFHRYLAKAIAKASNILDNLYSVAIACYTIANKLDADVDKLTILYASMAAKFVQGATTDSIITMQQSIYRELDMDFDRPNVSTFLERIAHARVLPTNVYQQLLTKLVADVLNFDLYVANRGSVLVARAIQSLRIDTECVASLKRVFPELFST